MMSVLRIAADILIGLAAILAAMSIGAMLGAFVFLLFGWSILIVFGDIWDGQSVFLAFAGFGAFFGLAALAAMWRETDAMLNGKGPF